MTPIQGNPSDAFLRYQDQDGNSLVSLNKDGSVSAQSVRFPDGSSQTSSSPVVLSRVVLSPAQIMSLVNSFPPSTVQLLAAPGSNKAYKIIDITFDYQFVTTPYTVDPGADLRVSSGDILSGLQWNANSTLQAGLLDQTVSTTYSPIIIHDTGWADSHYVDKAVNISNFGGPAASGGDGLLAVSLLYTIIDVS